MKLVRGSTKRPEAVTRFDNQRYIFNGMFYRSRRNLRSCYAYSSTDIDPPRATHGKRIFERITSQGGEREEREERGGRHAFGFRRLEFRFQPRNNTAAIPCNLRRFRTSQSKLNVY